MLECFSMFRRFNAKPLLSPLHIRRSNFRGPSRSNAHRQAPMYLFFRCGSSIKTSILRLVSPFKEKKFKGPKIKNTFANDVMLRDHLYKLFASGCYQSSNTEYECRHDPEFHLERQPLGPPVQLVHEQRRESTSRQAKRNCNAN